jgi:hypothetical protein
MPNPDSKPPGHNENAEIVPDTPEKMAFVRGLIARGEAAQPNPDGSLPKGATHEIIRDTPNGLPSVRRRRFY